MEVQIMSWNTALTESNKNISGIFKYIKEFLNKENSVAILQQIPFKIKENGNWSLVQEYINFEEIFNANDGYQIFKNSQYNYGRIYMMTVSITKMKNVSKSDKQFYPNEIETNRECAIEIQGNEKNKKLVILGIHAKSDRENISYLNSINGMADVILGDFNAGNYSESENIQTFNSILKDHVCICHLPTKEIKYSNGELKRKSCIDHIFVKRNFITNCSDMVVHEDVKLSDHYPISFKIKF